MLMAATVDTTAFEAAVHEYAEATGKTVEAAMWRSLRSWAVKAQNWRWRRHPKDVVKAKIHATIPTSKRADAWKWRLVQALMKRDGRGDAENAGRRAAYAGYERRHRDKSVGFGKQVIKGVEMAARQKGSALVGSGIRGMASMRAAGLGRIAEVAVVSRYEFKSPESRARIPREVANLERALVEAFAATEAAQVADMEEYIARKLQEKAPK